MIMSLKMKMLKANKAVTKDIIHKEALALALDLGVKASKFLLKKAHTISKLKVKVKKSQGVASEADLGSEKIIIDGIKKKFPDHFILAEESAYGEYLGKMERYSFLKEKEWVWAIDPLDGTNNFLNGLDYYAVCISLLHFGVPVVGVVIRPTTGECFYAITGKGCHFFKFTHNFTRKSGKKALKRVLNQKPLKVSLLVTGFTTEKGPVFEAEFKLFKEMIGKSRGIRRMGSAALDLCYVASGVFDAFWERGLAAWDVSAAGVICCEAGIKLTDYGGREFHPFQETILASRPRLHNEILSLFKKNI